MVTAIDVRQRALDVIIYEEYVIVSEESTYRYVPQVRVAALSGESVQSGHTGPGNNGVQATCRAESLFRLK